MREGPLCAQCAYHRRIEYYDRSLLDADHAPPGAPVPPLSTPESPALQLDKLLRWTSFPAVAAAALARELWWCGVDIVAAGQSTAWGSAGDTHRTPLWPGFAMIPRL